MQFDTGFLSFEWSPRSLPTPTVIFDEKQVLRDPESSPRRAIAEADHEMQQSFEELERNVLGFFGKGGFRCL